jgi:hypothetical protein
MATRLATETWYRLPASKPARMVRAQEVLVVVGVPHPEPSRRTPWLTRSGHAIDEQTAIRVVDGTGVAGSGMRDDPPGG